MAGVEATDSFMKIYRGVAIIYDRISRTELEGGPRLPSELDEILKVRRAYFDLYPTLTTYEREEARQLLGELTTTIGTIAAKVQIRTVSELRKTTWQAHNS